MTVPVSHFLYERYQYFLIGSRIDYIYTTKVQIWYNFSCKLYKNYFYILENLMITYLK